MPRLTDTRRSANRQVILDAARRCFARDGYHQTSMPGIAVEAGLSTGAPYRYFSGKQELVVAIAREAFAAMFEPVLAFIAERDDITIGLLVQVVVEAIAHPAAGAEAETDDLARCAVDAWGELLRNDDLRAHAQEGMARVTGQLAEAIRRTRSPLGDDIDPYAAARIVVSLAHGFLIQWTAFGPIDTAAYLATAQTLLDGPRVSPAAPASRR